MEITRKSLSNCRVKCLCLTRAIILSSRRHLLSVAPGVLLLSDALITSAVLAADRGALIPEELQAGGGGGEAGGSVAGFEFGVDPSLDPELAMVRHVLYSYISYADFCILR